MARFRKTYLRATAAVLKMELFEHLLLFSGWEAKGFMRDKIRITVKK